MGWLYALLAVAVIAIIVIICNIHIVPQAHAYVVTRLGAYHATWSTGFHVKIPFIEQISKKINMMEQVADFQPQSVITKDNVRMQIDTVVFYQITDCKLYAYGVTNPLLAIENLTATTLRNIIGELDLDNTLTSRDIINTRMRAILDEATDPWGIKVSRVELKNIIPPREIQDAMEKQMKAERERREAILRAEGERNSTILIAEGRKESMILEAEAEKQAAILRADAARETKIREAEGEAEAIRQLQRATAEGIRMINEATPSDAYIAIRGLEALTAVGNGQSTKLIIPSELQSLAGLVSSAAEVAKFGSADSNSNAN